MSKVRTLESFSKQDLIHFIIKSGAFCSGGEERVVRELFWIELERKSTELNTKMDALQAEIDECSLSQDWSKYRDLSHKWGAASRALSRLYKGLI